MQAKKPLLQAFYGEKQTHIPIWLMRQAGRYLPEYRELRASTKSFLDFCYNPKKAIEATLQPLKRYDLDAAIIFSDILVVPHAMGAQLSFTDTGPKLKAIKSSKDLIEISNKLIIKDFKQFLNPVSQIIKGVKNSIKADKTLIGFVGAPWTLACYMVDGDSSSNFSITKEKSRTDKDFMDNLIDILADYVAIFAIEQIKSGIDILQIFDSWASLTTEEDFPRYITAPTKKIVQKIHASYPNFPIIGFPRQAGKKYLEYAEGTGIKGFSIDQNLDLQWAKENLQQKYLVQGALDPLSLLEGGKKMQEAIKQQLQVFADNPRYIFNLGHGVIKNTPPENVTELIKQIREYERSI